MDQIIDIKLVEVAARAGYEAERAFFATCGEEAPPAWGSLEPAQKVALRDLARAVLLGEAPEPGAEMPAPLETAGSGPAQVAFRWRFFVDLTRQAARTYEQERAAYLAEHGDGSGGAEAATA